MLSCPGCLSDFEQTIKLFEDIFLYLNFIVFFPSFAHFSLEHGELGLLKIKLHKNSVKFVQNGQEFRKLWKVGVTNTDKNSPTKTDQNFKLHRVEQALASLAMPTAPKMHWFAHSAQLGIYSFTLCIFIPVIVEKARQFSMNSINWPKLKLPNLWTSNDDIAGNGRP